MFVIRLGTEFVSFFFLFNLPSFVLIEDQGMGIGGNHPAKYSQQARIPKLSSISTTLDSIPSFFSFFSNSKFIAKHSFFFSTFLLIQR